MLFLQVVQRRAKEQLDRVVMAFRAVNDCLGWNDSVFSVEQKRLFRRKMPVFPETFVAIPGAELPEGRKPRRAVSGPRARTG